MYSEHQNNKQKAKESKDRAEPESTIPEEKTAALLICSEFCCVHTDRALPLTIKGGWDFPTSQSLTIRSKMVSAQRGLNKVSTCQFEYVTEQSSKSVKKIEMFSDNCGEQNRNRFTAFALRYAR